jgi:predicted CoA-substrate-specific enzyme activase
MIMGRQYYAGIDIGASATKAVIIDEEAVIRGAGVLKTGISYEQAAEGSFRAALGESGLTAQEIAGTTSTGYGRRNTRLSNWERTEITCLSKGVSHLFPQALCIVDIGGQDNKMVRLDEDGRRVDFQMNRKCSAGTGAFLDELESLARSSTNRLELGAYCTVFTFSEMLTHLQRGVRIEDLVRGALLSVVKRIYEFGIQGSDVVLTGGVVEHNPMIAEMLEEEFKVKVLVPQRPQLVCAFGAALVSRDCCPSENK